MGGEGPGKEKGRTKEEKRKEKRNTRSGSLATFGLFHHSNCSSSLVYSFFSSFLLSHIYIFFSLKSKKTQMVRSPSHYYCRCRLRNIDPSSVLYPLCRRPSLSSPPSASALCLGITSPLRLTAVPLLRASSPYLFSAPRLLASSPHFTSVPRLHILPSCLLFVPCLVSDLASSRFSPPGFFVLPSLYFHFSIPFFFYSFRFSLCK